jgi:5-formyltetrahydrofolate cyclo-ligase
LWRFRCRRSAGRPALAGNHGNHLADLGNLSDLKVDIGQRAGIPKVNNETSALEHFYFEGLHQLTTNTWGIQEPKQGIPTEIEKIDLVLVPLLAFDNHGHRVGYGKGYYDKFLAACRPDCKKIGLSLFASEEKIDDVHTKDISLDSCITPMGIIEF